jgi:hypothetical protein
VNYSFHILKYNLQHGFILLEAIQTIYLYSIISFRQFWKYSKWDLDKSQFLLGLQAKPISHIYIEKMEHEPEINFKNRKDELENKLIFNYCFKK